MNKRKFCYLVTMLFAVVIIGDLCLAGTSVFAGDTETGGGGEDSGSEIINPTLPTGGDGVDSGVCNRSRCNNYIGTDGRTLCGGNTGVECMGYSWMYFKAVGPVNGTKNDDGSQDGESMIFRPTTLFRGIKEPNISEVCAGKDPSGQKIGFWHLGRNGDGIAGWMQDYYYNFMGDRKIYAPGNFFDRKYEEVLPITTDSMVDNNAGWYNGYAFGLYNVANADGECALSRLWEQYWPDRKLFRYTVGCALGHPATWTMNYIRKTYRPGEVSYKYRESDFGDRDANGKLMYKGLPFKVRNMFNNRYKVDGEEGTYVNRVQRLYKYIEDKESGKKIWTPIYESYKVASEEDVFLAYKTAYRAIHGQDYSGSDFPGDLYAFCGWSDLVSIYTLTVKAIDENGKSLKKVAGLEDFSVGQSYEGAQVHVTRGTNKEYIFLGWKIIKNGDYFTNEDASSETYVSGSKSPREVFNTTPTEDDATVYAVYREKSAFYGQIKINDNIVISSKKDEYTNESEYGYLEIKDCPPTTGCEVVFAHNLWRRHGNDSATYSIERESNYWHDGNGVEPKTLVASGLETFESANPRRIYTDGANAPGANYDSTKIIMKPGQVVCEILKIKVRPEKDDIAGLTACAVATGNAQPEDPNPDPVDNPSDTPKPDDKNTMSDAFLKMQVKNNDGATKYKHFQKEVYARPGQTLVYRFTYNPILQYTYYLNSQKMKINGKIAYPTDGDIESSRALGELFNAKRGNLKEWNNAVFLNSKNFTFGGFSQAYNKATTNDDEYSPGNTKKKSATKDHKTQIGEVGKDLKVIARTGIDSNSTITNDDYKTTPTQVSFAMNVHNVGDVITAEKTSEAIAYVPYNYDTSITIKDDDSIIDAGGEKTIDAEVTVVARNNPETSSSNDDIYATIARDVVIKAIVYLPENGVKPGVSNYPGGSAPGSKDQGLCGYFGLDQSSEWNGNSKCAEIGKKEVTLNEDGALNDNDIRPTSFRPSIGASDMPAGAKICVAVAVYPSNSGDYKNWSSTEGSKKWRISDSVCFTIGKKPTFQVWGGSLYGGKDITVSSTAKNNLTLSSGNVAVDGGVLVFSSWVEQTVVAKGKVDKLASGASTGLVFGNEKNKAEGGSLETTDDFCSHRVPLSIANYGSGPCIFGTGKQTVTGYSEVPSVGDKKNFMEIMDEGEDVGINDVVNIDGDYEIADEYSNVAKGVTRIIKANNITINRDIIYADDDNERYTMLGEIPKMIIYAKQNIYIGCGVTRIDAILLADGTVYTCGTYKGTSENAITDINEITTRTKQLQVNGAIFTNKFELGRTYGMSIGTYSKIPAEIINYDTSIILWAKGKTDKDDFERLHQVYINELAPRY